MSKEQMDIEQDDFEAWKAHPITKAVMAKASKLSEAYRDAWMTASWNTKMPSSGDMPALSGNQLAYLRGKAAVAESFAKLDFKDITSGAKSNE